MRAVVQRVTGAAVTVEGKEVSRIGRGLLVFLGVAHGDGQAEVAWMAGKVARMRVFSDRGGKMNLSLREAGGEILVVSQFTLLADCRKGNRPSFTGAAAPEEGDRLYRAFAEEVAAVSGATVRTGIFGAHMVVSIENDGPVTFVLDSSR
jgi:D-tyrosyl-tRNA(Tyr) deacylase